MTKQDASNGYKWFYVHKIIIFSLSKWAPQLQHEELARETCKRFERSCTHVTTPNPVQRPWWNCFFFANNAFHKLLTAGVRTSFSETVTATGHYIQETWTRETCSHIKNSSAVDSNVICGIKTCQAIISAKTNKPTSEFKKHITLWLCLKMTVFSCDVAAVLKLPSQFMCNALTINCRCGGQHISNKSSVLLEQALSLCGLAVQAAMFS